MVGANTFRNPGLTAKLAATLDHVSDGRAYLGIGGAWFEPEHDAFGIHFGQGFGERLDRLDEAVMLIRRLLDGERFSHEGRFYTFRDALANPVPLQAHLPILIGGSGPRKTLRTVARFGDAWNTAGTVEVTQERLGILRAHCAEVGRDIESIELTAAFDIVLRDDRAAAEATYQAMLRHYGVTTVPGGVPVLLGPPGYVAESIRPYVDLGFRTVIARLGAPYDLETIDRIREVRALLGA
jgi:alkanesulfonate monooxygenase SsuD/methylene tetrahydromethanopterin reductase-like flavin-dependent oxidoreductase (luciferase family)